MSLKSKDQLKELIMHFPQTPGVYIMKNESDKIIYVGKAKSLKNRVRSYFTESLDISPKTKVLVSNINEIEYILTKTEVEAFLLEASLIKKHRPKYNIRLKDDKTYPYIKITWQDEFPRLYLARKVIKDGAIYFGPYTSGGMVFGTIRFLNRVFRIRDCTDHMLRTRTRPCMTYQIGRCTAPCVKYISQEDYRKEIEGALQLLKGEDKDVISSLTKKMHEHSDLEQFEAAARLRDSIHSIEAILEKQNVINVNTDKDQDAIGYSGDERGCVLTTVHSRHSRVIGVRQHLLNINPQSPHEDPREWLVSFINQYYEDNIIPDEVLLPVEIGNDLTKLLEAVLKERASREIQVRFATDEKGRELVEMANENAKSQFLKKISQEELKQGGLSEIKEKLNLPQLPNRIECYDISHTQGTETVASMVVFEEGLPAKDQYRLFKIKTVTNNDFEAMQEVLSRRLKHTEFENPDLILIDGGKGQLSQVVEILKNQNRSEIPVASIAKARTERDFQKEEVQSTEERFFLPGRQNPVVFKHNSQALHILVGLRDEAHRFAIQFHRKRRDNASFASELDDISGLGEKRKQTLLKHFASLEDIKNASAEEIAKLKGFNRVLAERILVHFAEDLENNVS